MVSWDNPQTSQVRRLSDLGVLPEQTLSQVLGYKWFIWEVISGDIMKGQDCETVDLVDFWGQVLLGNLWGTLEIERCFGIILTWGRDLRYLSSPIPPWLVAALAVLTAFCPCLNWLRFSYGQQMPSDWEEVTGVYRICLHTTSSVGQGEANGYRVYQRNTWRTQQKWYRSRSSNGSNFIRCSNKIYVTKGTSFSHDLHVKIRIHLMLYFSPMA